MLPLATLILIARYGFVLLGSLAVLRPRQPAVSDAIPGRPTRCRRSGKVVIR